MHEFVEVESARFVKTSIVDLAIYLNLYDTLCNHHNVGIDPIILETVFLACTFTM